MQIKKVTDKEFQKYGRVLDIKVPDLLKRLEGTPMPQDVVYVASAPKLEACEEFHMLENSVYGGMPIQIGYCNGNNHTLNAVEYHRNSEINIPLAGAVLIVGMQQDVEADFTYDTSKMEAFEAPAGCAVELYATTLHYAPCGVGGAGFKVTIVLPKGTNLPLDKKHAGGEDGHLTAKNKWLLGHPEGGLPEGSPMGLTGKNLCVNE